MTMLSLIFLLADGPKIKRLGSAMGSPPPVARTITKRTLESLRGYFLGVTIVAAFNAVVVALGAIVLDPARGDHWSGDLLRRLRSLPGAWTAGAFSVLLALGGAGTDAAIGMIVVQLLANSVLQQLVQPLAMGAALGIHPLAVLIVTIAEEHCSDLSLILASPPSPASPATSPPRAEKPPDPEGATA